MIIALTVSVILAVCSLQRVYGSFLFEMYSTKKIQNITGINKPLTKLKYPVGNNLLAVLLTLTHYLSSLMRTFSILMMQYYSFCSKKQQVPASNNSNKK